MPGTTDVVVVGGGFAGVTASRELQRAGLGTMLVEARDRLGGRTWTSEFGGQKVEMGGTWVHWHQPYVWSEIRRYGLEITESAPAEQAGWLVGRELHQGDPEHLTGLVNEGTRRLCADAVVALPRPHDIAFRDVRELDGLSIQDRLDALELGDEMLAVTDGAWSTCASAHCRETGLLAALRWYGLAGNDPTLVWDAVVRYKIATGTRSLVEAVAADGGAEIRLDAPVSAIEHDASGVTVQLRSGEAVRARAVVVAVPLNVLDSLEFVHPLSEGKREVARQGQSSHGVKVWIRVAGRHSYFATAPSTCGLTWLQPEYTVEGDTLLVAFGPDAGALDVSDRDAVARVVGELMPQADFVDCHAHDWTHDEFAKGTWSMPRPGQMTEYLPELQRPEGRVVLAGSDVASGWNGFIDGAIESGLTAARQVRRLLEGER